MLEPRRARTRVPSSHSPRDALMRSQSSADARKKKNSTHTRCSVFWRRTPRPPLRPVCWPFIHISTRHYYTGVGGGSYNHTAPLRARLSRHGRTLRASRARATRSARATCARAQQPSVLPATTPTTHDCVTYTCSSCHPHRPHQPEPPRARWTRRARAHGALQAAHTHTQRTHSAHRQA